MGDITTAFDDLITKRRKKRQSIVDAEFPDLEPQSNPFINTISLIGDVINIPQQILYTFGKNIAEEITGNELNNEDFITELQKSVKGQSKLSFGDILKVVGADKIDYALPEEFQIDNPYINIPASVASGILAGVASRNPFIGITAGVSASQFLGGKGVVSSIVDTVADPANKLRLLQLSPKALNMSKAQIKALQKSGLYSEVAGKQAKLLKQQGKLSSGFFSQIAKGERRLFDFKGSSGLLIGRPYKVFEEGTEEALAHFDNIGYIMPTHKGFNFGRYSGIDPFADSLDAIAHTSGDVVRKFFPEKLMSPILKGADGIGGSIFDKASAPVKKLFKVGGDVEVGLRRFVTKNKENLFPEFIKNKELEEKFIQDGIRAYQDSASSVNAFENHINEWISSNLLNNPDLAKSDYRKLVGEQINRDLSLSKEAFENAPSKVKSLKEIEEDQANKVFAELEQLSEKNAENVIRRLNGIPIEDGSDLLKRKADMPQNLSLKMREELDAEMVGSQSEIALGYHKKLKDIKTNQAEVEDLLRKNEAEISKVKGNDLQRFKLQRENKIWRERLNVAKADKENAIKSLEKDIKNLESRKFKTQSNKVIDDVDKQINRLRKQERRMQSIYDMQAEKYKNIMKANNAEKRALTRQAKAKGDISDIRSKIAELNKQKEQLLIDSQETRKAIDALASRNMSGLQEGRFTLTELKAMREAITSINEDLAHRIKVTFSDDIGKKVSQTEAEIADAIVKVAERSDEFTGLVVRLHKARTVDSFGRIVGSAVYDLLSPQDYSSLKNIFGVADENQLREMFVERFTHAYNGKLANGAKSSGVIGKSLDKARAVLRQTKRMFDKDGFIDESVQAHFERFLSDTDFFANTSKAYDGKEFKLVRELIDENGKIKDVYKFKQLMDDISQKAKELNYLPEFAHLRANFHGIGYEPLLLKDKAVHDDFMTLANNLNINVGKRGKIGSKPHLMLLEGIQNSKELQEYLLNFEIVSRQELEFLLGTKFLSALSTPAHQARSILTRIASVAELRPYELFENDPVTLILNYANAMKNMEYKPFLDWVNKNVKFRNSEKAFDDALSSISNSLTKVYLSNEVADQVMLKLNKIKNSKNQALIVDTQDLLIEGQRTKDIPTFVKIRNNIKKIYDDNMISDQDKLDIESILEKTDIQSNVAGKEMIDSINNAYHMFDEEFLNKVFNATEELSTGDKAKISTGVNRFIKSRANNSSEAFAIPEVSRLSDKLGPNLSQKQFNAKNVLLEDSIHDFVRYEAKGKNTLPFKELDGAVIPKALVPVLDGLKVDPEKNFTTLGKMINKVVDGLNEAEARELGEGTAKAFNKIPGVNIGSDGIDNLSKAYQRMNFGYLTSLWKANALLSPAFHVRNAISAITVNSQFGVGIDSHIDSLKFLYRMSKYNKASGMLNSSAVSRLGAKKIDKLKSIVGEANSQDLQLFKELSEQGVIGSRAVGSMTNSSSMGAMGKFDPTDMNFAPYQFNFKMGESIEDLVRVASYKHARDVLNYTPKESAEFTKLLHFDYNYLTDGERRYLKRLIPFYSYFRLSLGRDSRMFLERTGEFNKMAHLIDEVERGIEPEDSVEVAHYIRENMGVKYRVDENGKVHYMLLGGMIPAADLVSRTIGAVQPGESISPSTAVKNIALQLFQGMNPIIKAPAEFFSNYSSYFNKPIELYEGQEGEFFGANIPRKYISLMANIRWLNDLNKASQVVDFLPHGDLRPDLPRPDTPIKKIFHLANIYGGVKLRDNSSPDTQKYIQQTLPARDAKSLLSKELKRGSDNAIPALRNYLKKLGYRENQINQILEGYRAQ